MADVAVHRSFRPWSAHVTGGTLKVEQEVDMNAVFADPNGTSPVSGQTTRAAVAPVSEFMRWNDMTITPSRLPPLETIQTLETAATTATDDD